MSSLSMLQIPTFDYFPEHLHTRSSLRRRCLRPKKGEKPSGLRVFPKFFRRLEGQSLHEQAAGLRVGILAQVDDLILTTTEPLGLYAEDQCETFKPRARTKAIWEYFDFFARPMLRSEYIVKTSHGDELPGWFTAFYPLTEKAVKTHINHREIIGVKGAKSTRFAVIDLDFHQRNRDVFLRQAKALMKHFHGKGWHYQISAGPTTGLQIFRVFECPRPIPFVQEKIREALAKLNARHPELEADAQRAGMRSLADLEIYPTVGGNGVRLPLCRGRTMVTDRFLEPIQKGPGTVGPVEEYMAWLRDPARRYMPAEELIARLEQGTVDSLRTHAPAKEKTVPAVPGNGKLPMKGNLGRILREFWLEGITNGHGLNMHILTLCRLARLSGATEEEAVDGIEDLVKGLPPSVSSRIAEGKTQEVAREIRKTAKRVYGEDLDDPLYSGLCHFLGRYPKFEPLKPETWNYVQMIKTSAVFGEPERERIISALGPALFVKDEKTVLAFVDEILSLVRSKAGRSGLGYEYLMTWIPSRFPAIKAGNRNKLSRILKTLEHLGVIKRARQGIKGHSAALWSLGDMNQKMIR